MPSRQRDHRILLLDIERASNRNVLFVVRSHTTRSRSCKSYYMSIARLRWHREREVVFHLFSAEDLIQLSPENQCRYRCTAHTGPQLFGIRFNLTVEREMAEKVVKRFVREFDIEIESAILKHFLALFV